LRERKDDLPLLIEHILHGYRQKQERLRGQELANIPEDPTMLPPEMIQAFYTYQWPGNVRELENVLQRYLATYDLESVLSQLAMSTQPRQAPARGIGPQDVPLPDLLRSIERRIIADTLTRTQHHIGETAELLGIPQSTLYRKIKQYQLFEKRLVPE
jgi:DNA-binding NtrC family response regulator